MTSGIAGLFKKLTFACGEGGFAGVDASGREFEQEVVGCVAVLPLKKDARLGSGDVDGQDDDRTGMTNHLADGCDAVGLTNAIASDVEDASAKNDLRG